MPNIFVGQAFAFENMTKVPATILTQDFSARTIGIDFAPDRTLNLVVKRWPTAARQELVLGGVQW